MTVAHDIPAVASTVPPPLTAPVYRFDRTFERAGMMGGAMLDIAMHCDPML